MSLNKNLIVYGLLLASLTLGSEVMAWPWDKPKTPDPQLQTDPAARAEARIRCRESCDAKVWQNISRCPDDPRLGNLSEIDPYGSIYSIENQALYGSKDRQCVREMQMRNQNCYSTCQ